MTNTFRFGVLSCVALITLARAASAQNTPDADADVDVDVTAAPPSAPAQSAAPAVPAPPPAPSPSGPTDAKNPSPAAPPSAAGPAPAPAAAPPARAEATEPGASPVIAPTPVKPPPLVTPAKTAPYSTSTPFLEVSGYVHAEYQSHADSEDQLAQGSTQPLNQNRFLIRRARLILRRAWQFTSLEVELDGNTYNGPSFSLYRAEASAYYRPAPDKAPLIQATLGQFRLPFGFELIESPSTRWFMERTQLSRALFPTEIDLGGRVTGEAGPFRYAAALVNGEPFGEKSGFQLQDPNKGKDFTVSAGGKGSPVEWLHIDGGVSVLKGHGFHPGTSATKGAVTWNDLNQNGVVDTGELDGTAPQAALKSQNFERWAIGGDLSIQADTPIGMTSVYGEVIAAENMDRGFFPADPIALNQDLREFGFYVGFLQQITQYGIVGVRVEYYDPNADATDRRAGKTLPAKNTVWTYSPLVGVTLPNRARLAFQYDVIKDYLARNVQGVPTDFRNNAWTLRLQVNL